ncbi:MAG: NAD(P)H-dependent glycerol-3-phosphate dehydrogenase [bacterium]
MYGNIFILGGGCWGGTVGEVLSEKASVAVWEWDRKKYRYLKRYRHPPFFPYVRLKNVRITGELKISPGTGLVVVAISSQSVRATLRKIAGDIKRFKIPVLVLSKGIEISTLKSMDVVCSEEFGANFPVAVLSGPSHAEELARRLPTSVVIASRNLRLAEKLQRLFQRSFLRPYVHTDIRGVALGGAIKNVMAIAAGLSDGLGLGANAKSALVTRGLVEMTRIGVSLGGRPATFSGLSGLGDLMVTCFSKYSRNRNLGEAIGRGLNLADAKKKVKTTAEGAETVKALRQLTASNKISAPITDEVYAVLYKGRSPAKAVKNLMSRPVRNEDE